MKKLAGVARTVDGISDTDYDLLQLLGGFARRTYGNEDWGDVHWQPVAFKSALTGDVSPNGLNNFHTGFQAHAWVSHDTKEVIFAIAGTNDLLDVLAWPTSITGQTYGQIDDVILAGQVVNALVTGDNAPYPGYHIRVTGHSLGGELAQIAAYTYGWDGVSFDGPGGGAVVDGAEYDAFVRQHGIVPAGRTGNFINVNVDGDGIYGGSLVGLAGYDVPGIDKHYYTRNPHTENVSRWHRDFSENTWLKLGFLPGKLICGVLVHFLDFIRKDIEDGNLVAHAPAGNRIYLPNDKYNAADNQTLTDPASAVAKTATATAQAVLPDMNRYGDMLQEFEGNVFSCGWSLASQLMQLHLDEQDGVSVDPSLAPLYEHNYLAPGMLAVSGNQSPAHVSHR